MPTSLSFKRRRVSTPEVNFIVHSLFITQKHDKCLTLIDKHLASTDGLAEYPLYVKAVILRSRGQVREALALFEETVRLNPTRVDNLKQVARSQYLLGRHTAALGTYDRAQALIHSRNVKERRVKGDWELWHNKGLCHMYLGDFEQAEACLVRANTIHRRDITYLMIGKLKSLQGDDEAAARVFQEAIEFSPDNAVLQSTLGQLLLRGKESFRAFDQLGRALSQAPNDADTLLSAASIIQANGDYDGALSKYRAAAQHTPDSPQLWNNIGMCFFAKRKHGIAVSCLKRALFLAPLEWMIAYNLGIVHLTVGQYASAFHYLNAAVQLNPDLAMGYMYLAVVLVQLDDAANAMQAYQRAAMLADNTEQPPDMQQELYRIPINMAITAHNMGDAETAQTAMDSFRRHHRKLVRDRVEIDDEVLVAFETLRGIYPEPANAATETSSGNADGAAEEAGAGQGADESSDNVS